MNKHLKICLVAIIILSSVFVVTAIDSYLQSVVGHTTSSIYVHNREATHYVLRYNKFNQWYDLHANYSRIPENRIIDFRYTLTRYDVYKSPFVMEVQFDLYIMKNQTYRLLEANVTHLEEVRWSGDPELNVGHVINTIPSSSKTQEAQARPVPTITIKLPKSMGCREML